MIARFKPSILGGSLPSVSSKSAAHRALICAALADGCSKIDNLIFSEDILATLHALKALGARSEIKGNRVCVHGISEAPSSAVLNCNESGSTLRFLIPVSAALGVSTEFHGTGRLPQRPITPYLDCLAPKGISFDYRQTMPFSISGKLKNGTYRIPGNISSQFITGLLFALPLLDGDSQIVITEAFESKPYVDMTIQTLSQFGIYANLDATSIHIPGNQCYTSCDLSVEGDFSQAAFFLVAGALGNPVRVNGLDINSAQGDKEIISILKQAGADVTISENSICVFPKPLKPFCVQVNDIPDLVPILAVLACFCSGVSRITGAQRLKIKESNRLQAIADCLNTAGGKVQVLDDALVIEGVPSLHRCRIDSYNDHRIAMAMAVASVRSDGLIELSTAECVKKSYPDFYKDFNLLGGHADVIDV